MTSKHQEYHTHDFLRSFIYSDWSLFGIRAFYIKIVLIALMFLSAIFLKQILIPDIFTSPFLFMYIVIMISTALSGFEAGFFVTILAIVYFVLKQIYYVGEVLDYGVIFIFFIQGLFYSAIIGMFLRILLRLRRQADLLTLTSEAIIVRDVNSNKIIYWSKGAEKIYGYTRYETVDKEIDTILPTQYPVPYEEIQKQILQKGNWEGEVRLHKKNSKKIIVYSRRYLEKNQQNRPAVIVEIHNDITTRKALERRKDEFLSIASHELKTPVTSIKAFTQILESRFNKIGDKTSQLYLSKMNTQLNRLTNLVNDLLDSTRIEAGKLELNIELFKLVNLVDEVIENTQLTSSKHTIIRSGDSREMVWGDRDRTEQVLINLINNAIKYSPHSDKVIVHIVEEKGFIKVGIEDRGIGIPKDKIRRIFDRFYRVEAREGEFSGLGLGLYISAEIIRRQNGQMWVESEENMGSIFYFTLPTERVKNINE